MNTDLVIIGGGAAGLMAGATAGELGLRAIILERKHQPGRKLLMCGNNRCNLTSDLTVAQMLERFGGDMAEFLRPSLQAFSPKAFCEWLIQRGLPLSTHKDGRVFPKSEKAADVLHFFTDYLRDYQLPVMFNCPVAEIRRLPAGFQVVTPNLTLECTCVLIATGGVSYPKTGSVGDGQKFAKNLGHKVLPYRPGLAGFDLAETWLHRYGDASFPNTLLKIVDRDQCLGETSGEILCTSRGARGPAMVDASRIIARQNPSRYTFLIDLCPDLSADKLANELQQRAQRKNCASLSRLLGNWLLPPQIAPDFVQQALHCKDKLAPNQLTGEFATEVAEKLKHWTLTPLSIRPLKEAMVTIGGVKLDEVNPETLESRLLPNLFLAGEVLDVDGPTGGFNLQAAFSTARQAVQTIASRVPTQPPKKQAFKPAGKPLFKPAGSPQGNSGPARPRRAARPKGPRGPQRRRRDG
jgi:predicted Rossmann fold flavoprotein